MSKSTLSSTKVATIKLGNFDSKGIFPETFCKTFPKSTGKILSRFETNITLSRESVDIKTTWLTRMLTECVMMTDVHPRYVFSKVNFFCGHMKTFNWFSLHSSSCVRALFWKPLDLVKRVTQADRSNFIWGKSGVWEPLGKADVIFSGHHCQMPRWNSLHDIIHDHWYQIPRSIMKLCLVLLGSSKDLYYTNWWLCSVKTTNLEIKCNLNLQQ